MNYLTPKQEQLVVDNLYLIDRIIKRFGCHHKHKDIDNFRSDLNLALMQAAKHYKGFSKFSTYAYECLKMQIYKSWKQNRKERDRQCYLEDICCELATEDPNFYDDTTDYIRSKLDLLPDDQKEAVLNEFEFNGNESLRQCDLVKKYNVNKSHYYRRIDKAKNKLKPHLESIWESM